MGEGSSEILPAADAVAPLASLVHRFSACRDESAILAVTMDYLQRFRPQSAQFMYLHLDAQGVPRQSQWVADWRYGQLQGQRAENPVRFPLASDPLVQRCLSQSDLPLLIADFAKDQPEAAQHFCESTAGCPAGCQAMALLPLHSECYGGWQGLLVLYWESAHEFSSQEGSAYKLLMGVLATHIGGLRSHRALADALAEAALLQKVTEQLNVASDLDQALGALLLPAPDRQDAEVVLCSIDTEPDGTPAWLTVINTLSGTGQPVPTQLGMRYYLPDIPFSKLYTSSPDAPILIGDIESDSRVDEHARNLYRATGARATIVMALTLQGRWIGLFNVTWRRPVALGEREQRLYHALAKQAALILDNTRMIERLRMSFKQAQEQSALLKTVLDHIPVSVILIDAATGKILLGNAWLDRMLGQHLDTDSVGTERVASYHMVQPGTDCPLASADLPSQRAIRTAQVAVVEVDFLPLNSPRLRTEATAVPLFDDTGAVKRVIVLLADLTARKSSEEERARLQQEVIRVQAAALIERSSPLIPITDDILVLPLIGSIDTERGHQLLDTVLQGASQRGARVTIIDITGVRTIDTHAALALTNAALALRLLGVEPVLTGIRPEVAQTLVGLGVHLSAITTRSTLQSGIQYALHHLRKTSLG